MEIKESFNGESKIMAVTATILIFTVVIFFVVLYNQNIEHKEKLKQVAEKAYINGYLKGKKDGANQIIQIRHELDSIAFEKLNTKNRW